MAWYSTGTVAVVNGSGTITGTGTGWVTNNGATGGNKIHIKDSSNVVRQYEIGSVSGNEAMTLQGWTYAGATEGSLSYKIEPVPGALVDVVVQLSALIASMGSIAGLAPFAKDIIQFDGAAYVSRTPLQYITDQFNAVVTVDVPSAATCDIGAALSPWVRITGAVQIDSLGTAVNCWRMILFASAPLVNYNATSLITRGAVDLTATAGMLAIAKSDSAGNWRIWDV